MIVGMDFGTTNSGMAVYDGTEVTVLPLDPANANPKVARTALYVTNDQDVHIGRGAVDTYFEQNIGRSVKMQKVWVGEVEVMASEVYYIQDVYVWTDILSPGRLFLSIKTALRDANYVGTVIGTHFYSLENLIALYLGVTKMRAEKLLGQELKEVVLGRPVRFAFEPEADELAQQRLLEAAFRAGYETVYFQKEPIAAAYHYASTVSQPQNILIFDFGGGTLDLTVMGLGDGEPTVLATGGIPVAGDVFDQKLTRAKLPHHFGEGALYGGEHKRMPMPIWVYDAFSSWQTILELQKPETLTLLNTIAQTSQRPRDIKALVSLVSSNHSLTMFDTVEQAKRKLSDGLGTLIKVEGEDFSVTELVTRNEFEQIIRADVTNIDAHIDETVALSGLTLNDIDVVIRTGGSAQIPVFKKMLDAKFPDATLREADTFSSVTAGLGIYAHGIATGDIEAKAYRLADAKRHVSKSESPLPHANLELILKRSLIRDSEADEEENSSPFWVSLHGLGEFELLRGDVADGLSFAHTPTRVVRAEIDEPLLLISNLYRLMLTSARKLRELAQVGLPIAELFKFNKNEQVMFIGRYLPIRDAQQFVIVTSKGFARPYRMKMIREPLDGYGQLAFDSPLDGVPIAALGMNPSDQLITLNSDGRATRLGSRTLKVKGIQAMGWRKGERVVSAMLVNNLDSEHFLLTETGHARKLRTDQIDLVDKANQRGKILISKKPVVGLAKVTDEPIIYINNNQLVTLSQDAPHTLDLSNSTKAIPLAPTNPNEIVTNII